MNIHSIIQANYRKVKSNQYSLWWSILASVILILYVSELVESSMYIDGVWYAVISQNLSQGIGSFWFPKFSETFFSTFHEHPPLMFGIQSWYFSIFGNAWLTERFYSFTQYGGIAVLIVFLWRKTFYLRPNLKKIWFIPLLFWQVNLANYYYLPANLLESPLTIFNLMTIAFLWKVGEGQKVFFNLLIAGFLLFLAFLTKGFVGLFPLAFLGIYWLIFRQSSFITMMGRSILLLSIFCGYFIILFLLQPQAIESLTNYLDVQVLASLKGERRLYYFRENRFFILGQMGIILFPMLIATVVNILITKRQKETNIDVKRVFQTYEAKIAFVFLLTGLSASLPIIISPRQALPYLLPSIPFFSLSIGIILSFFFFEWWEKFTIKQVKWFSILRVISGGFLLLSITFCMHKFGKSNHRDSAIINDAQKIGEVTGKQQTISSTEYNMYISGYLMRFNQVSIDTSNIAHPFLVTTKGKQIPSSLYKLVPLSTLQYDLYQKIAK